MHTTRLQTRFAAAALLAGCAGAAAQQHGDLLTADEFQAIVTAQAQRILQSHRLPPGVRIIDGDMIFPLSFDPDVDGFFQINQWAGGVVPYNTDSTSLTSADIANAVAAMQSWAAVANVTFIARTNQADYIHFQDNGSGNNSSIGHQGGVQNVNFTSGQSQWIVAHEIGHALGFLHEHQRPDRTSGGFVTIRPCNVQGVTCDALGNVTGSTSIYNNNFPVITGQTVYGPFDFDSIMAYQRCSFSICCPAGAQCNCTASNSCETIQPQGAYYAQWAATMGQRAHLSTLDQITMRGLYPFSGDRWLDRAYVGTQNGTLVNPWNVTFASAEVSTPSGGTLFIRNSNTYSAIGTYSHPVTISSPNGVVTLGN